MGGRPTSTSTNTTTPWEPAQPALRTGLTDAQNLYAGGIGGAIDTTSHVIPFANQTNTALNAGQRTATQNINGNGLSGQYQNIINSGGYNQNQQQALNGIRQTATGGFNPYANEGFGSVLKQAQDSAMEGVNMNAAAAGRYGSGVHQGSVAREVGNVTGGLLNNEWNNFNQRRDGAQSALFNAGQQGQENLGAAYQGMQAPLNTLRGIGAEYEDLATRGMNDRSRIFDAQNNMPWMQLARLNGIASGAGTLGGSSSGTATAPGQNPFGSIFGGLLGASGLFGGGS